MRDDNIILYLCFTLAWLMLLLVCAMAHDPSNPQLNDWMAHQSSTRSHCCNGDDAVTPDDWRSDNVEQCKVSVYGKGDSSKHGHYCVLLEGTWWLVPDETVIDDVPNLAGHALVWLYQSPEGPYIRCFMAGPGA